MVGTPHQLVYNPHNSYDTTTIVNVSTYVTGTALPSAHIISTYFDQENLRSCPQNSVAQKSGGDEVLAFPRNDVVKRPELWAEGTMNHGEKIKKQRGTLGAENLGTVGGFSP